MKVQVTRPDAVDHADPVRPRSVVAPKTSGSSAMKTTKAAAPARSTGLLNMFKRRRGGRRCGRRNTSISTRQHETISGHAFETM